MDEGNAARRANPPTPPDGCRLSFFSECTLNDHYLITLFGVLSCLIAHTAESYLICTQGEVHWSYWRVALKGIEPNSKSNKMPEYCRCPFIPVSSPAHLIEMTPHAAPPEAAWENYSVNWDDNCDFNFKPMIIKSAGGNWGRGGNEYNKMSLEEEKKKKQETTSSKLSAPWTAQQLRSPRPTRHFAISVQ